MRMNRFKSKLFILATILLLGSSMTVSANSNALEAKVKSFVAKNVTIYTNGDSTKNVIPMTYKWDCKKGSVEYTYPDVKIYSNNRGVFRVGNIDTTHTTAKNGKSVTTANTISLTPIEDGSAKLVFMDRNNTKKKKIVNVLVKTYADTITYGDPVITENGEDVLYISNEKNSQVSLNASVNDDATNQGLTYAVEKSDKKNGISVSKTGVVKVTKAGAKDTTIVVTSKDKNVTDFVEVKVTNSLLSDVKVNTDTESKKDTTPGVLNAKYVLNLKNNVGHSAHSYLLNVTNTNNDLDLNNVTFISSNKKIASVNKSGLITALNNGTAKISVYPKLGNRGKAVATTITVKVSTDVENIVVSKDEFEVLANGKQSVKINASTNRLANNKKVTYTLEKVTDKNGNVYTDATTMKTHVNMSKSGVVKMKQPSVATIKITSVANKDVNKTITVKGLMPVTSMQLVAGEEDAEFFNGTYYVYRTSKTDHTPLTLIAKVNEDATNSDIIWSSSNKKVADVENGVIKAKANGTTTITAKTADNSGLKKTVKVKVLTEAYDIIIPNLYPDGADEMICGTVYVEGSDKAKSYNLAKVIKAKTNSDASKKTIYYRVVGDENASGRIKSVSLKAGDSKTIKIETPKMDDDYLVSNAKFITLVCLNKDEIADEVTFSGLEDQTIMVGDTYKPVFNIVSNNNKTVIDPSNVKLSTSNKKVAAISNGEITAKAEGIATITAKYGNHTLTSKVYIGRNKDSVETAIENVVSEKLGFEIFDYTGIRTHVNKDNNAFTLELLKPENSISMIHETGLIETMKELLSAKDTLDFTKTTFSDGSNTWTISVSSNTVSGNTVVTNNDQTILVTNNTNEAVATMFDDVTKNMTTLSDINGYEYTLTFDVTDTRTAEKKTYSHSFAYTVKTNMDKSSYENSADAFVENIIETLYADTLSFDYDKENDTLTVNASNYKELLSVVEGTFSGSLDVFKKADVSITVTYGEHTITLSNKDTLLSDYSQFLKDNEIYRMYDMKDVVIDVDITFTYGKETYTHPLHIIHKVDVPDYDGMVDKAVANHIKESYYMDSMVTYDADTNTMNIAYDTFHANLPYTDIKNGGGYITMYTLDALVENENVVKVSITDGTTTTEHTKESLTDEFIFTVIGEVENLAALDGKVYTILVHYDVTTIEYTVNFSVIKSNEDPDDEDDDDENDEDPNESEKTCYEKNGPDPTKDCVMDGPEVWVGNAVGCRLCPTCSLCGNIGAPRFEAATYQPHTYVDGVCSKCEYTHDTCQLSLTQNENGFTCDVCNKTYTEADKPVVNPDIHTHVYTSAYSEARWLREYSHVYQQTEYVSCDCGYTKKTGNLYDHMLCSDCDLQGPGKYAPYYSGCTLFKNCSVCGDYWGAPLKTYEHTYDANTGACTRCGYDHQEYCERNLVANEDGTYTCSVCGHIRSAKEATCRVAENAFDMCIKIDELHHVDSSYCNTHNDFCEIFWTKNRIREHDYVFEEYEPEYGFPEGAGYYSCWYCNDNLTYEELPEYFKIKLGLIDVTDISDVVDSDEDTDEPETLETPETSSGEETVSGNTITENTTTTVVEEDSATCIDCVSENSIDEFMVLDHHKDECIHSCK